MSSPQKRKRTSNPVLSLLDLPTDQLEQIVHSLPVESLESLRRSSTLLKTYVESTVNVLQRLYQDEIAKPLKQIIQQNPRKSNATLNHILSECDKIINRYPEFIHNEYRSLDNLKTSIDKALHKMNDDLNKLERSDLTAREKAVDQKRITKMGSMVSILQKIDARIQQLS
jgi:ElaB/YqjD/DUF883 family membrane-anchored ribosome-binding protein